MSQHLHSELGAFLRLLSSKSSKRICRLHFSMFWQNVTIFFEEYFCRKGHEKGWLLRMFHLYQHVQCAAHNCQCHLVVPSGLPVVRMGSPNPYQMLAMTTLSRLSGCTNNDTITSFNDLSVQLVYMSTSRYLGMFGASRGATPNCLFNCSYISATSLCLRQYIIILEYRFHWHVLFH